MWTILLLTVCHRFVTASEFDVNNNGWRPISSEVVYRQMRQGFFQPLKPRPFEPHTDLEGLQNIVAPENNEELEQQDTTNSEKHEGILNYNEDNKKKVNFEYDNTIILKRLVQPNKTGILERKSKKLTLNDDIQEQQKNNWFKENVETTTRMYEVTENLDDEVKEDETFREKSGYEYLIPDTKTFEHNLLEYLIKYNIKEDDILHNYDISRRRKNNKPTPNILFNKSFKFNNLNHLSTDPLLAVFLSNYGYYLQGQYGIQNNYNNLYGYLASNNIHNNRPFGLYKVFSDTDSSQ